MKIVRIASPVRVGGDNKIQRSTLSSVEISVHGKVVYVYPERKQNSPGKHAELYLVPNDAADERPLL